MEILFATRVREQWKMLAKLKCIFLDMSKGVKTLFGHYVKKSPALLLEALVKYESGWSDTK